MSSVIPLRFSRFELYPAERVLRVHGEPVVLGSRAFDLAQRQEGSDHLCGRLQAR